MIRKTNLHTYHTENVNEKENVKVKVPDSSKVKNNQ